MDVLLRPVTDDDLDQIQSHSTGKEGAGEHQWFGFRDLRATRRELADNGLLSWEGGRLTVDVGGVSAGYVRWSKRTWGPWETSWCWTLAISLFPEFRGQGIGTEAQRELVAYLWAHSRAERIEAITDVTNLAEQRALEKAGFEREGVIRRAQWREGAWHDQVLYSQVRPQV
ncbi:GNAT family N-acetyltransferase [Nonomuraea sp. NBC_01738]|uniref:GNAT family N-acetyltransferase n=1 Tax=Nonomuraea sp. NBC_01738 TaxID=2976003 RepID=UPI002E132ADD|nr:GNAT family N-acetyltransferase [Nonomuraea sp. NBC_01738]